MYNLGMKPKHILSIRNVFIHKIPIENVNKDNTALKNYLRWALRR